MSTNDDKELTRLAERYVALWNEPDPALRRTAIDELFALDGAQVLVDPPEAVRDAATDLAVPIPSFEARGREALNRRVSRAYEMFIAAGEHTFTLHGHPVRLTPKLIGLAWTMVTRTDGAAQGGGYEVIALDEEGRIRLDHQYIGLD
ncbi:hypothetical protein [Nocardia bhagyanarayanae]|uniref:SnoaL-like protein n=1 Tax=Nocardia bhagyanarayanae TaxID=1215925 RepID=A0A543EUU8_9NOCA|nr:hypothetical protein [Nocardia bhagyanarayanae]TQM25347.1 hypothetical protein FB390_5494 [Nocardia bhagyanarayanae]